MSMGGRAGVCVGEEKELFPCLFFTGRGGGVSSTDCGSKGGGKGVREEGRE